MAEQFPVRLEVQIPGQKNFSAMLSRYREGISDFTPFWNDYFLPTWYALMLQQYATQGGATGTPWAPLTANYAAWKQKHWPGQPIGVLTGRTRDSLTAMGDPHSILTVSKDQFAVGTNLDYPIYLQLGTRRMASRPPMRVDKAFMNDVGRLLQKFAFDMARKAAK